MSQDHLPKHVAIVPDGNRRWARKRGLPAITGHWRGADKTREQVKAAFDMGLDCLTWWGGSWNNLTKRSKKEIDNLFKIYEKYFKELIDEKNIYKNQVKVSVIGRWSEIAPESCKQAIRQLISATKKHNKKNLNFLIAYDGQYEMIQAIKSIVSKGYKRVDENILKKHLWTGFLPPIDLLIRTGSNSDPHNSAGFMMWLTANSQLYFPKGYYPDFGKKEFKKAIEEYQRRERRLGR